MRRYVTSVGLAVFVGLGILLVHSAIVEALESRVNPRLLDFDGGRAFLVTTAQAGPDYDGFGCATTSTWKTRVLRRSRRASASSLCLKTFSATLTA